MGTVSGGPMYYIEYGLGKAFKPLAMLVAGAMILVAFMTGNAIQANTVSDLMNSEFGISTWITGSLTAAVVATGDPWWYITDWTCNRDTCSSDGTPVRSGRRYHSGNQL